LRLESLKENEESTVSKVLLSSWLVELKIAKLNRVGASIDDSVSGAKKAQQKELADNYKKLGEEIMEFLQKYSDCLHIDTIFQLFQNHGRINDCIQFAMQKV